MGIFRIFPYIGLIYGRYLQFRFLKWPLTIPLYQRYAHVLSLIGYWFSIHLLLRFYKSVAKGNLMLVRVTCLQIVFWSCFTMHASHKTNPSWADHTQAVLLFMICIFNGATWVMENPSTSIALPLGLPMGALFFCFKTEVKRIFKI